MRVPLLLILIFQLSNLLAQSKSNVQKLHDIANRESNRYIQSEKKVKKYLLDIGLDSRWVTMPNGRHAFLERVENGVPYYISTSNLQARKTTNVNNLSEKLGEGNDLEGTGITVGVWDGGQVLVDHVEFGGRVVNKNGFTISNHATHVTGTIAAAGINPNAKGMAPKAKVISYYAFENDLTPMALEAANGLILSNHSYGYILGWDYNGGWQWYGGSGDIDSRFGHYSSKSATIDEIAYNAPYYTIVWAVGNDRNDVGDGTKPPDGPYNIIDPSATTKNGIAVGAITGFDIYEGPQSAVMSSFSCWGPTNDGRVKPDLVADGVGVLSTSSSGIDRYVVLQGTSMATPNVTGSLVPIQEYFRHRSDTFLTSAALKALVIHTAREAGLKPGPDPQFGWGVLNTFDALKVLRDRNDSDTILVEAKLLNDGVWEYEFFSDGITPITATLAWTDPPGTPGAEGNINPMLVNDLDLRIFDDESNEYLPWMLNIENPLIAQKADNSRDNVEKIEFTTPYPRKYTISVSHKNQLFDNEQNFGLVFTGGAIDISKPTVYYWLPADGDLSTAHNWSNLSGGLPKDSIDFNTSSLIFDNNSILYDGAIIQLNNNIEVDNFIWLADAKGILDLNGYELVVNNNLNIVNNDLVIRNGTLTYNSATQDVLNLGFNGNDSLKLNLNNKGSLLITSDINIHELTVNGIVSLNGLSINVNKLQITALEKSSIWNCHFYISESFSFSGFSSGLRNNYWDFNAAQLDVNSMECNDVFKFSGVNTIVGKMRASRVTIHDQFRITDAVLIADTLDLMEGSTINLAPFDSIIANNQFNTFGSQNSYVSLSGTSSTNLSYFVLNYRDQVCVENINIENMKFIGDAVFNVPPPSILVNSVGFYNVDCNNLIYSNFEFTNDVLCANSIVSVRNLSLGPITNYYWKLDGAVLLSDSTNQIPSFYYSTPGEYDALLQVNNELDSNEYLQLALVEENNMDPVRVIENSSGLVSDKAGDQYQWYLNHESLPGATSRTIKPMSPGQYQVAYYLDNQHCSNRLSEPFDIITGTIGELPEFSVFPNPFSKFIQFTGLKHKVGRVLIYDNSGIILYQDTNFNFENNIDLSFLDAGIYFIEISSVHSKTTRRIIKYD